MKSEYLVSAMLTAFQISNHSHCVRRKAGAVIIARDAVENRPVVLGWGCNGMPSGHDTNCCEIPASDDFVPQAGDPHGHLMTHPDVMHAEIRALHQAGERARGAIVLCTDTPCPLCMEALDAAGIAEFHYLFDYRLMDHLQHATFKISKMDMQSVLNFQRETTNALYERIASEMDIKVANPSTKFEATMQALGMRDFEGGIKRGALAQIRPTRTRHSVMRSALVAQSLLKGSAFDREKSVMFDPSKSVNVPVFTVVEQEHGSVLSALQRWYTAVHGEPLPAGDVGPDGVAGPDGIEVVEPVRFGYCPELEAYHSPDDSAPKCDATMRGATVPKFIPVTLDPWDSPMFQKWIDSLNPTKVHYDPVLHGFTLTEHGERSLFDALGLWQKEILAANSAHTAEVWRTDQSISVEDSVACGPEGALVDYTVGFTSQETDNAQAAGDWRTNVGEYFQVEARAVQLNDNPDDIQP